MGYPKVLIFTPIYEGKDYCLEDFLQKAKAIDYPNARHLFIDNSANLHYYYKLISMGLDVVHVDRGNNSREAIARACNYARKIAIDEGYDYLLSLESDVMVPPNIVQLLLEGARDVITALYFIGDRSKNIRVPCVTLPEFKKEYGYFGTRVLTAEEYPQFLHKGQQRVQAGGMGCCLMYRKVFLQIPFSYEVGLKGHPDIYFFNDCFRLRIPVYVDTDIVLDHQNVPWSGVADR